MSKHKTNPRKKLVTQADVDRAKREATDDAIKYALGIFLYVMYDKEGWGPKRLTRVYENIKYQSDCVAQGYVNLNDMLDVLEKEGNIVLQ